MKEIKITKYECEFCQKIYKLNIPCECHEKECYFNPKQKSCETCSKCLCENEDFDQPYCKVIECVLKRSNVNCPCWEKKDV